MTVLFHRLFYEFSCLLYKLAPAPKNNFHFSTRRRRSRQGRIGGGGHARGGTLTFFSFRTTRRSRQGRNFNIFLFSYYSEVAPGEELGKNFEVFFYPYCTGSRRDFSKIHCAQVVGGTTPQL